MPKYRLRVQDLCWTEMTVTVEAETEREAVEKVAKQDDDVEWGTSTVFWEAAEKTEILDESGKRTLWSSETGFADSSDTQEPISELRIPDGEKTP